MPKFIAINGRFLQIKSVKPRFIYYDTETTGIRHERDRIIELAAYDPVDNRTFAMFINPGSPIPPEATAIHHITDEMVQDAPSFGAVAESFIAFCPPQTVLVAHNNDSFDKLFMEAEFQRSNTPLPDWRYFDTLKWARRYRPDLPKHSLQHLREVYGVPANQAHRALDDVMVLYQVFSQMFDDLSPEMILQLLSQPKKDNQTMPFGKHQGKPLDQVPKNYVAWLKESGSLEKPQNKELKESFIKLGVL